MSNLAYRRNELAELTNKEISYGDSQYHAEHWVRKNTKRKFSEFNLSQDTNGGPNPTETSTFETLEISMQSNAFAKFV